MQTSLLTGHSPAARPECAILIGQAAEKRPGRSFLQSACFFMCHQHHDSQSSRLWMWICA